MQNNFVLICSDPPPYSDKWTQTMPPTAQQSHLLCFYSSHLYSGFSLNLSPVPVVDVSQYPRDELYNDVSNTVIGPVQLLYS